MARFPVHLIERNLRLGLERDLHRHAGFLASSLVDDTGIPKKSKHSVRAARQYCGELGKQATVKWPCPRRWRAIKPACRLPCASTSPMHGQTWSRVTVRCGGGRAGLGPRGQGGGKTLVNSWRSAMGDLTQSLFALACCATLVERSTADFHLPATFATSRSCRRPCEVVCTSRRAARVSASDRGL